MIKSIMASQQEIQSRLEQLECQNAQASSSSKQPMVSFPSKPVVNPKSSCSTVLFSNENGGIDVVDEKSLEMEYANPVATIGRDGESSKALKEESMANESERIVADLVKVLASPPLREAIKNHPVFSNLFKDVQGKGKAIEENVNLVSKDKDPKALSNKEKDALYKARKSFKDLGINLEKGKDLNQVHSQLEFAKAILANKDKVEKVIKDFESPKAKLKVLEKKDSPGMFSIPCTLGDFELEDAFCDSGSYVSVISSQMVDGMKLEGMQPSTGYVTFGDQSTKRPNGVFKDFPIKVGNCIVPTDLLVIDMVDGKKQPLLLGIPFLITVGAKLDYVDRVVCFEHIDRKVFYPLDKTKRLCGIIFEGSPIFKVDDIGEKVVNELKVKPPSGIKKKVELKTKMVNPMMDQNVPNEAISPLITLVPIMAVNGKLECDVHSRNGIKPFAKAKIVLKSVSQDNEGGMLSEAMARAFGMKLEDHGRYPSL